MYTWGIMPITDRQRQAKRLARKFFAEGTKVEKDEVQTRLEIKDNSYYNYASILKEFDLAVAVPSDTSAGRSALEVTEKGKEVLAEKESPVRRGPKPGSVKAKVLTPQTLQGYVNEYNRKNPDWPFELVPQGYRKEVTNNR